MRKMKTWKLALGVGLAWLIVLVGLPLGLTAYRARRPSDMPANSVWIDAPAVPFGFYHGWWLGCWIDSDQQSNRCRLYGPGLHPPVVYEGRFVACETKVPVPVDQLKIKAPSDSMDMWMPSGGVAVILQNGDLLVPMGAERDCVTTRARLDERHELPVQTP